MRCAWPRDCCLPNRRGGKSILSLPWVYRLFAHILGIEANRQWFIDDVLCLRDGQKLVDVGCGAADILDHLRGVAYVGLDMSDIYIQTAKAKFKTRGGAKFLSGSVEDWTRDPLTYEADLVLTNGALHHVDGICVSCVEGQWPLHFL